MEFADYLKLMVAKEASDLYLTVGAPPSMRIHGHLKRVGKTPVAHPEREHPLPAEDAVPGRH